MIARCTRQDDVARCVEFARAHELAVAVRSGGHSFLGWGTCDAGMVIDLAMMKDIAIDRFAQAPAGCLVGFDQYMHGEVCRVAPESTAFELRAPGALHTWLIQGWRDPTAAAAAMAWADETWAALRPFSGGRMYANYPNAEGEPAAKATYSVNYARLASLKKKYDPTNLFRRNVNIEVA